MCPKDADEMANSADLIRLLRLGLHCLPRPVSLNTYGHYGKHVLSLLDVDIFYISEEAI